LKTGFKISPGNGGIRFFKIEEVWWGVLLEVFNEEKFGGVINKTPPGVFGCAQTNGSGVLICARFTTRGGIVVPPHLVKGGCV